MKNEVRITHYPYPRQRNAQTGFFDFGNSSPTCTPVSQFEVWKLMLSHPNNNYPLLTNH
jgi:hypothetical protein